VDPIIHLVTNKLRLRQDTPGGKVYLETFKNGAWTVKAVFADAATAQVFAVPTSLEVPVPLGFIPTGLATDTTGVKLESKQYLVSAELLACAKAAYFESDLQELTGGTVDLELYDYTAAAVRTSLTLSATSKRERSADILASLVTGNPVGVRFNVTAAGADGSVGGGCSPVLILVLGAS